VLGDRGDLDPEQLGEGALGEPRRLVAKQHADLHGPVGRGLEQQLGVFAARSDIASWGVAGDSDQQG
jgi:hypothetical protein